MANSPIVERIRELAPRLSASQQAVARFVLTNRNQVAFQTARQLAEQAGVSEATTIRFAQTLGFEGFPAFRAAIQSELLSTEGAPLESFSARLGGTAEFRTSSELIERVFRQDATNLALTLREVDIEAFDEAARLLSSSRRVAVVGRRATFALASVLVFFLRLIRRNVEVLSAPRSELFDSLAHLDRKDVVVGISFHRYSRETEEVLAFARQQGARVVAVTDTMVSPLVSHADVVLLARNDAPSFVDSFVAAVSMLHALVLAVAVRDFEGSATSLDRLERIWNQKRLHILRAERRDELFATTSNRGEGS